MFHLLGCLGFLFFFVFLLLDRLGLRVLFGLRNLFFGKPQKKSKPQPSKQSASSKKKVFDDNEGDYVDFEEIK